MGKIGTLRLVRTIASVLLCGSLLLSSWPGTVYAKGPDELASLVSQFEQASGDAQKQMNTAIEIFKKYPNWNSTKGVTVSAQTAQLIDKKRFQMAQNVFGTLANKGGGVNNVVPIGSAAAADPYAAGSKFKVGASDIDLIPLGDNTADSADKFRSTFKKMYGGLDPDAVKINVLTETNIKDWKSRVSAMADYEKYNTLGGNKAMQKYLYESNGSLWHFSNRTGEMQVGNARAVLNKPAALDASDALGYFSDNTRFIAEHAKESAEQRIASIAKYNLRNAEAYKAAGGVLTEAQQSLLNAAEIAKGGKVEEAMRAYLKLEPGAKVTSSQMKQYLSQMDSLTNSIGREVTAKHIDLINKTMSSNGATAALRAEMAQAMVNLPKNQVDSLYRTIIKGDVAKDMLWQEAKGFANAMSKDKQAASFAISYFNKQAEQNFGKLYSELTNEEKFILHGASDEVTSFANNALKTAGVGLGVGFAAWGVYDSYQQGKEAGGTSIGISSAFARAVVEGLEYGNPPIAVAEAVGRLAAAGINMGIDAYKNKVLEKLYKEYKADPKGNNLDDILATQGVDRYNAGALRQMAIEMRKAATKEGRTLSEAQIDQEIKGYFERRLDMENQAKALDRWTAKAEAWMSAHDVALAPGDVLSSDNDKLKKKDPKEYNRLMGALLNNFTTLEEQLRKDKVAFTEGNLWYVLMTKYQGPPEALNKALQELYAGSGKSLDVKDPKGPATTPATTTRTTPAPATTTPTPPAKTSSPPGTWVLVKRDESKTSNDQGGTIGWTNAIFDKNSATAMAGANSERSAWYSGKWPDPPALIGGGQIFSGSVSITDAGSKWDDDYIAQITFTANSLDGGSIPVYTPGKLTTNLKGAQVVITKPGGELSKKWSGIPNTPAFEWKMPTADDFSNTIIITATVDVGAGVNCKATVKYTYELQK